VGRIGRFEFVEGVPVHGLDFKDVKRVVDSDDGVGPAVEEVALRYPDLRGHHNTEAHQNRHDPLVDVVPVVELPVHVGLELLPGVSLHLVEYRPVALVYLADVEVVSRIVPALLP